MSDDAFQSALVESLIGERRNDRRWRIIRTFIWVFLVLLFFFLVYTPGKQKNIMTGPHVSLIRLNGVIMPGAAFSAYKVVPLLDRAFKDKTSKGVVLLINSPGGSPVQASIIHDKIEYLKHKFHKKVVVIGQDALASGAYLVATAADKIYVHKDTVTGSIGVIMSGFGFVGAINKLGITRRVFTAGTNKDRLDPFEPTSTADKAKVTQILTEVHQDFIDDVKQGRAGKLNGNPSELFSGDFWTGTRAVKLGLADGTGNLWDILKSQFGVAHYRDYSARPSFLSDIIKGAETKLNFALENQGSPLKEEL